MKTIAELEQENADLRRMNESLKSQLIKALEAYVKLLRRDLTCAPEADRNPRNAKPLP